MEELNGQRKADFRLPRPSLPSYRRMRPSHLEGRVLVFNSDAFKSQSFSDISYWHIALHVTRAFHGDAFKSPNVRFFCF